MNPFSLKTIKAIEQIKYFDFAGAAVPDKGCASGHLDCLLFCAKDEPGDALVENYKLLVRVAARVWRVEANARDVVVVLK